MMLIGLMDHWLDLLGVIFLGEKIFKTVRWYYRRKHESEPVV